MLCDHIIQIFVNHISGFGLRDRIERYLACLDIIINHGVEPPDSSLLETMRILLRQLKHVPLTKRQPEMEPVFKMLIDYSLQPTELKLLCRRVIRTATGHPVANRIEKLIGIGPKMKSYLRLEDIGSYELYS